MGPYLLKIDLNYKPPVVMMNVFGRIWNERPPRPSEPFSNLPTRKTQGFWNPPSPEPWNQMKDPRVYVVSEAPGTWRLSGSCQRDYELVDPPYCNKSYLKRLL